MTGVQGILRLVPRCLQLQRQMQMKRILQQNATFICLKGALQYFGVKRTMIKGISIGYPAEWLQSPTVLIKKKYNIDKITTDNWG